MRGSIVIGFRTQKKGDEPVVLFCGLDGDQATGMLLNPPEGIARTEYFKNPQYTRSKVFEVGEGVEYVPNAVTLESTEEVTIHASELEEIWSGEKLSEELAAKLEGQTFVLVDLEALEDLAMDSRVHGEQRQQELNGLKLTLDAKDTRIAELLGAAKQDGERVARLEDQVKDLQKQLAAQAPKEDLTLTGGEEPAPATAAADDAGANAPVAKPEKAPKK